MEKNKSNNERMKGRNEKEKEERNKWKKKKKEKNFITIEKNIFKKYNFMDERSQ